MTKREFLNAFFGPLDAPAVADDFREVEHIELRDDWIINHTARHAYPAVTLDEVQS